MKVVDIDGDGLLDVLCSATIEEGTGSYIAYYNGNNNWEQHDAVTPAGDGIAVVRINGVCRLCVGWMRRASRGRRNALSTDRPLITVNRAKPPGPADRQPVNPNRG
jgi:hypothetical protein